MASSGALTSLMFWQAVWNKDLFQFLQHFSLGMYYRFWAGHPLSVWSKNGFLVSVKKMVKTHFHCLFGSHNLWVSSRRLKGVVVLTASLQPCVCVCVCVRWPTCPVDSNRRNYPPFRAFTQISGFSWVRSKQTPPSPVVLSAPCSLKWLEHNVDK